MAEETAHPEQQEAASSLDEVMRQFDKESIVRQWTGGAKRFVDAFLACVSLYCIWVTLFSTALPEVRLSLFMGIMVSAGFLVFPATRRPRKPNSLPWYDILLAAVGTGCFFYHACHALPILKQMGRITPLQIAIGVAGLLCLAELCRRCVGLPILCVAGALLIYAFCNKLGYRTPFSIALRDITNTLFYTTSGVIGTPVNVCFTYIVLFIIFGAFLERTGIAAFFIELANRLAGWSRGGPAKVAVLSSALCGMVSGSSVGNTVTTGALTIPLMKRTGYKPEFAGAVEAAASTGGQIMPPIMGAAAFLMAEYMGVPYVQVATKAILPALLYFAGIFIAVHLEAKALGLKGLDKSALPRWGHLARNTYLLIPLVLLIALVTSGARTMAFSAAVSIGVAFVIGLVHLTVTAWSLREAGESFAALFKRCLQTALHLAYEALTTGARGAVTVSVACGIAGLIAGCITTTGLASILINAIVNFAGNATLIGLLLTMLCCIVLGMGVPTTANYCIMASTCAPILVQLGFPVVPAHFFVFYFGIVADITPPVALAAYAGAAIAKANPMQTGLNATKLAIAAFIVPYIFAYSPQMLMVGMHGGTAAIAGKMLFITVTALLGLFGVAAALNGFLFRWIPVWARLLLAVGGLLMLHPGLVTDACGLLLLAVSTLFLKTTSKQHN